MDTFARGNIAHLLNPFKARKPYFRAFPGGWQELWEKLVEVDKIDVQLNTPVKKVIRKEKDGAPLIVIQTDGGDQEFDRVIITAPHLAHNIMELTADEKSVFERIQTLPYKTTLVEMEGLPRSIHLWPRAYTRETMPDGTANDGRPVLISNHHGTNVYQVYQFTYDMMGKSKEEQAQYLKDKMIPDLEKMGAKDITIVREDMFDYYPRFSIQDFKDGIPHKMDDLQGVGGVYYTGAVADFEIVERAAEHADQMVDEHF